MQEDPLIKFISRTYSNKIVQNHVLSKHSPILLFSREAVTITKKAKQSKQTAAIRLWHTMDCSTETRQLNSKNIYIRKVWVRR